MSDEKLVKRNGDEVSEKELKSIVRQLKKLKPDFNAVPTDLFSEFTEESVCRFGLSLFERWDASGGQAKEKWMLLQASLTFSDALIDKIASQLDDVSRSSFRRGAWHVATLEQIGTARAWSWIRWWASIERIPIANRPIALRRDTHEAGRRYLAAKSTTDEAWFSELPPCDALPPLRSEFDATPQALRTDLYALLNSRMCVSPDRVMSWGHESFSSVAIGLLFKHEAQIVCFHRGEWIDSNLEKVDVRSGLMLLGESDLTELQHQRWGMVFADFEHVRDVSAFDQFSERTVFSLR